MLELRNLCGGYGGKDILEDISISFESGSITSVIGANGCGKSTLLQMCCGLLKPSRGQVVYLSPADEEKLPLYKSAINVAVSFFTFQKYRPFNSRNRMTGKNSVRRVVALPGDSYYMKDYVLYVKPAGQNFYLTEFELTSKPYNIRIYSVPAEWDGMGCAGSITETNLAKDEYYVLADNRIEGIDSRSYGPVKAGRIKGRLLLQVFPFNKMSFF